MNRVFLRKVDEENEKIRKDDCRKWNYLCVRRG